MQITIKDKKTGKLYRDPKDLLDLFNKLDSKHQITVQDLYRFELQGDGSHIIRDFEAGTVRIPSNYLVFETGHEPISEKPKQISKKK
ncbi:MAG: hypothetical protein WC389_13200 [Lutibacter sp.]|jgi:hypothetical protein